MQSAVPHVLATLDRTHDPDRVPQVVGLGPGGGLRGRQPRPHLRHAGGDARTTGGASLDAALDAGPDHVSAYALVVEEGTRMAGQVRRGEIPAPDDDDLADRYLLADEVLAAAGFEWYEVSNWARGADQRARHNEGYWRGHDWWGVGPGAHSHVGGTRWWNVRHPTAYAGRLAAGASPAQAREVLTDEQRRVEQRAARDPAARGAPARRPRRPAGRAAAARAVDDGLLDPAAHADGRAALTLRGRLLADAVVRDLVD